MKSKIIFVALCISSLLVFSCNTPSNPTLPDNGTDSTFGNNYGGFASQQEWGKHLIIVTGCGDCHTPKKMTAHGPVNDESLTFSGAQPHAPLPDIGSQLTAKGVAATYDQTAWTGPWGKSFAANITSDSTGIGTWSEAQFMNCLRKGILKGITGSRPLMPPMPWQDYSQMSDTELKAVFAYLKSTKPVKNVVPAYQPPAMVAK